MRAYIKNLHDHILEPEYKGIMARCDKCGYRCSANKGDYWNMDDKESLKCPDCKTILHLVRQQVSYFYAVA